MKVFEANINEYDGGPVAIGLGNFDGVHLGHSALVKKLTEEAKKRKVPSMIYTFKEHPMKVLNEKESPELILKEEEKINIFKNKGVDMIYFENFTEEYSHMSPQKFIKKILTEKFKAAVVVVGEDFTFGKGGTGTPVTLKKYGEKTGSFDLYTVELFKVDGKVVSSTEIRKELDAGNVEMYEKYTGRKFEITGEVSEGRKVGRRMDFPTANINPDKKYILPGPGVYCTVTEAEGREYRSVTNVGNNPTFGCEKITVETHLIGYSGDLYGKKITVRFIKKIRDEIRFEDQLDLKKRIAADIEEAGRL